MRPASCGVPKPLTAFHHSWRTPARTSPLAAKLAAPFLLSCTAIRNCQPALCVAGRDLARNPARNSGRTTAVEHDVVAKDTIEAYEEKVVRLERLLGRQALELGASRTMLGRTTERFGIEPQSWLPTAPMARQGTLPFDKSDRADVQLLAPRAMQIVQHNRSVVLALTAIAAAPGARRGRRRTDLPRSPRGQRVRRGVGRTRIDPHCDRPASAVERLEEAYSSHTLRPYRSDFGNSAKWCLAEGEDTTPGNARARGSVPRFGSAAAEAQHPEARLRHQNDPPPP